MPILTSPACPFFLLCAQPPDDGMNIRPLKVPILKLGPGRLRDVECICLGHRFTEGQIQVEPLPFRPSDPLHLFAFPGPKPPRPEPLGEAKLGMCSHFYTVVTSPGFVTPVSSRGIPAQPDPFPVQLPPPARHSPVTRSFRQKQSHTPSSRRHSSSGRQVLSHLPSVVEGSGEGRHIGRGSGYRAGGLRSPGPAPSSFQGHIHP